MSSQSPIIWSTQSSSLNDFKKGLEYVAQHASSIMVMACSDNDYNIDSINQLLSACTKPICGGNFPQIIEGDQVLYTGAIIIGFHFEVAVHTYTDLSAKANDLEEYIENSDPHITQHRNFVMFADAFCSVNEDFIHYLYEYMGSGITVIGGGAGSLEFIPKPCIFTNHGLIYDAVQLVGITGSLSRNIGHGWEVCDGPYLVTAAEGHRLDTLDYLPAFEIYHATIKKLSGQTITQENFFNIAKDFPLGISHGNNEILVRDPIVTDLQFIECVGNIPTNATINFLKGDQSKLIGSSKKVASTFDCIDDSQILILFDCISRSLYLQDNFTDELRELQKTHSQLPMIGALSLGEITNSHCGSIDFLNKSTVLGMM
jgi:hypothetical protein